MIQIASPSRRVLLIRFGNALIRLFRKLRTHGSCRLIEIIQIESIPPIVFIILVNQNTTWYSRPTVVRRWEI